MARAILRESASTLGNGIWGDDAATAGGDGDAGAAPPRGASAASTCSAASTNRGSAGAPDSTGDIGAAAVSTAGEVAAVRGSGARGGSTAAVSTRRPSVAAARGSGSRGADSTDWGSAGAVSTGGDSTSARSPERANVVRDLPFLPVTARRGAGWVAGSPADALDASGSLVPAPPFSSGLLCLAMATCFLAARSCFSTY